MITSHAQEAAFFHLNTAEGLSDNQVNDVKRDKNGILWIGTSAGLNCFDGLSITTYFREQYPVIGDNNIKQVICDDHNRIWLRTDAGNITMLDNKRRFHAFPVGDNTDNTPVRFIIQTRSRGIIALKGKKHFSWKDTLSHSLQQLTWNYDSLIPDDIRFISHFDEDRIIFCGKDRLVIADYARLTVPVNLPFPSITAACRINDHELIAFCSGTSSLYRINLDEKKIVHEYKNPVDQNGQVLSKDLRKICRINENQFVITSRFSGAYLFDIKTERLQRWQHNPIDHRSIGGDNTYTAQYDTSGYLFITSHTSGLHYFNVKLPAVSHQSFFVDDKGKIFDGYIQDITIDKKGTIWLGAQDRLIQWDRATNKSSFISYRLPDGTSPDGNETIRSLMFDPSGNLWAGTSRYGIIILDQSNKITGHLFKKFNGVTGSFPSNWINSMCTDQSGNIWVATLQGFCKVNPATRHITSFSTDTILAPVCSLFTKILWFDRTGRLWIGNPRGAWCYDPAGKTLKHYSTDNGLLNNNVLAFNEDLENNIYIGTANGLTIIKKDSSIIKYDRTNGLRNDRCEGILLDNEGFIWIGNLNCILRYDPASQKFGVFEEGSGFSHAGFRMRSCFKSSTGELFWGSDKGLHYFYPKQLNVIAGSLYPSVNAVSIGDSLYRLTTIDTISIPYAPVNYRFNYSSGELSGLRKIQFMYRLAGYESDWNKPVVYGTATYSRLPPGDYQFELKASRDGKHWFNASNPVSITVLKPWWQQTWFRLLVLSALGGILFAFYYARRKKKQAAVIQQMIDHFAHSGYDQSSVTEILWDIARNCMASLEFEDCVIYLLDEEKNVLVQKAAYGPKNPQPNEILNPIAIPVGSGIVGHVAQTGKALIVNDTSRDERYIIDDTPRLSEITVPLIHEGKVIGIIDSEHRRRHFFKQRHLKALQTIASLCSAKISRAMAVEAMKKSREEVMELNIRMAESKFLNLRLQMNPHFLFNSLSSIQNLIVSEQTTRAYKYLTVFSNFLRSLLNHAEKNFITLDEELAILNMYVKLESLRFDNSFQYDIQVDESLLNEEILVPSLMIQPFAENAIWHGLMHKKGDKKLWISFTNNNEDYLTCIIADNGIGREQSQIIRQKKLSARVHESKGIRIVEERLRLLQQKTGKPAKVLIQDQYTDTQEPAGTRVIITIPYYNPEV